jgi:hypothetical protein
MRVEGSHATQAMQAPEPVVARQAAQAAQTKVDRPNDGDGDDGGRAAMKSMGVGRSIDTHA